MSAVPNILYHVLLAYLSVIAAYLLTLSCCAYFYRCAKKRDCEHLKIAILIPAHNEEAGIGEAVAGILNCDYPPDVRKVFVLADNCTDNTRDAAARAGAAVHVRNDPANRGKGQCLDWFLKVFNPELEGFDVITIVDADTRVHPQYLRETAAVMAGGDVQAMQAFYGVLNPNSGSMSAFSRVALNVFHHLRPAGRNFIGGTAGLKGNGMAFSARLLLEQGWPCHSIVEDLEFSVHLLLKGVRVIYNPDARVYAEMPATFRQGESQRKRWESGRIDVLRRYLPELLPRVFDRQARGIIDCVLDLLTPPLTIFVLAQICALILSWLIQGRIDLIAAGLLPVSVFYVASGLIQTKSPPALWIALLKTPVYILWKIWLYIKMIFGKKTGWVRTERISERSGGGKDDK